MSDAAQHSTGIEDTLKGEYLDAIRHRYSFAGMNKGRYFAEGLVATLLSETPFPAEKREGLSDLLKKLRKEADGGPPDRRPGRAVEAALGALLQYGNYAHHFQNEQAAPPLDAADAFASSLMLVAEWYFSDSPKPIETSADVLALPLRKDPKRLTTLAARWRLRRAIKGRPVVKIGSSVEANEGEWMVDAAQPPVLQLKVLDIYCGEAVRVASNLVRVVLERETTFPPEALKDLGEHQLERQCRALSRARPEIVPLSVWGEFAELVAQADVVRARVRDSSVQDVDALRERVVRRDPLGTLISWYEEEVVRGGAVEAIALRPSTWGWLLACVFAGFAVYDVGKQAGIATGLDAVARRVCSPPNEGAEVCVKLAALRKELLAPPPKRF